MSTKLARLAERRERLTTQSAAQRTTLAHDVLPWRKPLALADKGLAALRYIEHHPAWIVGGVLVLVALQPRRAVKWLQRGWVTWQIIHRLLRR